MAIETIRRRTWKKVALVGTTIIALTTLRDLWWQQSRATCPYHGIIRIRLPLDIHVEHAIETSDRGWADPAISMRRSRCDDRKRILKRESMSHYRSRPRCRPTGHPASAEEIDDGKVEEHAAKYKIAKCTVLCCQSVVT